MKDFMNETFSPEFVQAEGVSASVTTGEIIVKHVSFDEYVGALIRYSPVYVREEAIKELQKSIDRGE